MVKPNKWNMLLRMAFMKTGTKLTRLILYEKQNTHLSVHLIFITFHINCRQAQ